MCQGLNRYKPIVVSETLLKNTWSSVKPKYDFTRVGETLRRVLFSDEEWKDVWTGFEKEHDDVFTRRRAFYFTLLVAAVYAVGFVLLSPERSNIWVEFTPALAYIIVLLMVSILVLSPLTLFFDRFRVPIIGVIVVATFILPRVFSADYYYQIDNVSCNENVVDPEPLGQVAAYKAWAERHKTSEYPVLVVIAAGGGGIKAAAWSTTVLTNLERELGVAFGKSILLISATSGGGVGTMYFVDAYTDKGPPTDNRLLAGIVSHASTSSLGALGWGVVYLDFWRLVFGIPLVRDRAWAQEQRWAQRLEKPTRSLREWRRGIKEGWRPILIFNATVSETGEQLLISPIDLSEPGKALSCPKSRPPSAEKRQVRSIFGLYPKSDMSVVTAARLSATFPYVTPIARPVLPEGCPCKAYHIADGGYYDNFGVLTNIQFLNKVLPVSEHKKVLLIQIRASDSEITTEPREGTNITDEALGPLKTMLSVRTSSQILRNDLEIDQLVQLWSENVEVLSVIFELDNKSPLSWHLSESEKQAISEHWQSPENQKALCQTRQFFVSDKGSAKLSCESLTAIINSNDGA